MDLNPNTRRGGEKMSFRVFGVPLQGGFSICKSEKSIDGERKKVDTLSMPIQDDWDERGLPLNILEKIEKGEA